MFFSAHQALAVEETSVHVGFGFIKKSEPRASKMATVFGNVWFGSYDGEGKIKEVVDVPHRLDITEGNDTLIVNLYNGKLLLTAVYIANDVYIYIHSVSISKHLANKLQFCHTKQRRIYLMLTFVI